jgi:predicted transposase YbfD/YdcC
LPKKTLELAENAGATLITQVKDNQKTLHNQIKHGCSVQQTEDVFEEDVTKQHGRIEKRKYEVFNALPMLEKWKGDWPYIRKIIKVTRYREEKGKKASEEISYYVTNDKEGLRASGYGQCIRNHWFIENKLHYVKDHVLKEDFSPKRVNPFTFSICADFGLNIMRSNGDANIKKAIYRNSLDFLKTYNRYRKFL